MGQTYKIYFDLSGTGWHTNTESLNAEKITDYTYRLLNTPFYAYEYNFGDIIEVICSKEGLLFATKMIKRSGHSTFRVFFSEKDEIKNMLVHLKPLLGTGCNYEHATHSLFAIDVPPETDLEKVIKILKDGEATGVWQYEEGYLHKKNA
ncbi:MAG: DUF4265 domain-containing protein [bacterium]|nr:DUF4265 domain-containing protein [bacterium]